MSHAPGAGTEHAVVSSALAAFVLPLAYVTTRAVDAPPVVAAATAVIAGGAMFIGARRTLPDALSGLSSRHRVVAALWVVVTLLALLATARLSAFMLNPWVPRFSVLPKSSFMAQHSCFSSYFEAARVAPDVPNVYAPAIYRPTQVGRFIGPLWVDPYEYPPPFLVLPRLAVIAGASFFTARTLWFTLEAGLTVAALVAIARFVGGAAGVRIGLFVSVAWLAVPVRLTLQMGNFQLAALALSILGMVLLARGRLAAGAALLSFAIVAKLFPALLLVDLAVRKKYRELGAVLAGVVLFCVAALVLVGPAPFGAFLHFQLPRIASGEAFPALRALPWAVAMNHSVYGLVLKVGLFGAKTSFSAAAAVAWVYSAVILAIAVVLGRRRADDPLSAARFWVLLLALGALRSPFLPQEYATLAPLFLAVLFAADMPSRGRAIAVVVGSAAIFSVLVPKDAVSPRATALIVAVPQLVTIVLMVLTARMLRARPADATEPQPEPAAA